jgi:hypothetical protein
VIQGYFGLFRERDSLASGCSIPYPPKISRKDDGSISPLSTIDYEEIDAETRLQVSLKFINDVIHEINELLADKRLSDGAAKFTIDELYEQTLFSELNLCRNFVT